MNKFNDNTNKKNLNSETISFTTYRTNYSNDEMMNDCHGVPNKNNDGGSSHLEENCEETIDVSTYTEPVEIYPTSIKEGEYDGMKKVTVTLSNIPSLSQARPSWTNLGEYETAIDGDVVVPDGVKVCYYNEHDDNTSSFVGDGVTTLSAEFSAYSSKSFTFVASFGNDIAMVFNGTPDEEEENVSPEG